MYIYLISDCELDGSDHGAAGQRRRTLEVTLQFRHECVRIKQGELAQTLGDYVPRAFLVAFAVFDQYFPNVVYVRSDHVDAVQVGALVADDLFERVEQQVLTLRIVVDLVKYERYVFVKVTHAQIAEGIAGRRFDFFYRRRKWIEYDKLKLGMSTQLASKSIKF